MKTSTTVISEHVADIAVDSGRIYISDPCTLDDLDVDKMRQRVVNNPHMAALPSLRYTVVSTGTGDGLFPLFIDRDENGKVLGLYIDLSRSQ